MSCATVVVLLCAATAYGIGGSTQARATTGTPIRVTALSTSNCYPLTPLTLHVDGLTAAGAITVRFALQPSGRLIASEKPLSVQGTSIVVAVPIVATQTGVLSHGSATLSIAQGGRVSATRHISIAPLPTDATYGMAPGQISKVFLDLQASMIGERLDELEAGGAEFGVDTTAAQETLNSLLNSTLQSLNDVNRIIADPTTVIDGPTTSSGFTPQVNEQFIETMDQIYGAYLVNAFGSYASSSGSSSAYRPQLFAPSILRTLVGLVKNAAVVNDAKDIYEKSGGNIWLQFTAVAAGSEAVLHQLSNNKYAGELAEGLPIAAGLLNIGFAAENEGFTFLDMMRAQYQGDSQSYQADLAQIELDKAELIKASGEGLLTGLVGELPSAYQLILDLSKPLVGSESELLQGAAELLGLAPLSYSADEEDVTLVQTMANDPPVGTGIGMITGVANVTSDAGVGAPLDSTQLCCVSSGGDGINGMVDPDGTYELWYPLGVPNTDYSSLTLNLYDFVGNFEAGTFTALSWEDLNLTTPTPGQSTVAPTMSATCTDTDWQTPDGDDPDCD
jgi:hypothetical protein